MKEKLAVGKGAKNVSVKKTFPSLKRVLNSTVGNWAVHQPHGGESEEGKGTILLIRDHRRRRGRRAE